MKDFRAARRFRFFNRTAQVVLALSLVILLNLIALKHYQRRDLTGVGKFTLSAETRAYLQRLEAPVEIYLTKPGEEAAPNEEFVYEQLSGLLEKYREHARVQEQSLVTIEEIDVFRQRQRAQMLVHRFGVSADKRNALVVASGEHFKEVDAQFLFEEGQEESTGETTYRFMGERAVTSAILEVTQARRPVAYFLAGHSELEPGNVDPVRGMSEAANFLRHRNWDIRRLDLSAVGKVPDDASVVIVASPQYPLLPQEVQMLNRYLFEEGGRMLVLLEARRNHGMDDLLYDWGIRADDLLVVEPDPYAVLPGGDILVSRFAEHPVTDLLIQSERRLLFGECRPVLPDFSATPDQTREVMPLLAASAASWGERNYRREGEFTFNQAVDLQPVFLGCASVRRPGAEVDIARRESRLLVIGDASFVSNQRFRLSGNTDFFYTSILWLSEQDNAMLGIPPRQWKPLDLNLSEQEMRELWLNLLYLPGGIAFVGAVVVLWRRR